MNIDEAKNWLEGQYSAEGLYAVEDDPSRRMLRVAQHEAAATEQAYYTLRAYREGLLNDHGSNRRMTDDELLDRAIDVIREQHHALLVFHQNHGGSPVFEDICCRPIVGDVVHVLAEAERREDGMP